MSETYIVFVCESCRRYNQSELAMPGFVPQDYETESLSTAMRDHVYPGHEVRVKIVTDEAE